MMALSRKPRLPGTVIVNAPAPGLNASWPKRIVVDLDAESEIALIADAPKVARSFGPSGTSAGIQFAAVSHSPLTGFAAHVMSVADAQGTMNNRKRHAAHARLIDCFILVLAGVTPAEPPSQCTIALREYYDFPCMKFALN
jgi:hypothetical protein